MDPGLFLIIIVIVAVIVIVVKVTESSNKEKAQQSATDKIRNRGIQQSIIKQSPSMIYYDRFSHSQGVLVLTWDILFFFGIEKDFEIPVSTIRSTSTEQVPAATNIVVLADSGTYRFSWYDDQKTVPGVAATGGGFAAGMGLARSTNANVHEWIQLIDDLRLGRLKKPS